MVRRVRWDLASLAGLAWAGLLLGFAGFGFLYPWSHTVANVYVRAGRNWWAGQDLYATRGTDYFRYSPLFAVGMTPFALLPDRWGNALWRAGNGLLYAAGLWAWARRALPGTLTRWQRGALALLALPISLHSMYNAQANLLMLGAALLAVASAAAGRWNRAAAWMALATLVKGYPLALALLLTALYPRRFALRYLGALALGLLLPFAAQRPAVVAAQYASWLGHLRDSTILMRERLRSLDHLLAIYGQAPAPQRFWTVQVLAGVAVLALCRLARQRGAGSRQQLTLTFQLFAAWVVLFGPATEACTYVVIAPAIAWALVDAFRRGAAWPVRLLLILSLLLMGPFCTDLVGPTLRNFANEHGSQPIGALLFLAYLIIQALRVPSPEPRAWTAALVPGRITRLPDAAG